MLVFRRSNFFIRLSNWEFWPFWIIQGPLFIYWLWLSLKSRSLFFFTASNPGILMGGMMGESKFEVLTNVPESLKPKTILVKKNQQVGDIRNIMERVGLHFPVIAKPDIGERGWMVKKLFDPVGLENYKSKFSHNFLIQEFIDLPLEFGVHYCRIPNQENGAITSVTGKEMLFVVGDGTTSLQELILSKDRAKLQWTVLKEKFKNELPRIPMKGERIELISIGNHCLGTTFIDRSDLITEKLSITFDQISKKMDGFYFGRFDLRASSTTDLENGHVKIMEVNGCGAEPSHIYNPGNSLFNAYHDLFYHWRNLYKVSTINHKKGIPYLTFKEGKRIYMNFTKALRN